MEPWQFWWTWPVQVAIAVGTIGAVWAALFGHRFRLRRFPPQLVLSLKSLKSQAIDSMLTDTQTGKAIHTPSRWYHLALTNQRRWSPATKANVYLVAVEEPDAAGEYKTVWQSAIPMKVRHQGVNLQGHTVGHEVQFDLLAVYKNPLHLSLETAIPPAGTMSRTTQSHKARWLLQARSIEADSNVLRVDVSWDGQWSDNDDDMMRHLVLKAA